MLPKGAISGQKISFLFEQLASERARVSSFDQLPIPYRAVAADILSGDKVVLGEGNMATAMRASMSIPGAFDPVVVGDHLLVDGGIVDNVPVDVARAMGADIIIAVDVGSAPSRPGGDDDAHRRHGSAHRDHDSQEHRRAARDARADKDVLIVPDLGNKITTAGFDKSKIGIELGMRRRAQCGTSSLATH